ncbi:penicillin-insensitive murein endopeptidase [Ponticoccus sp. SC2-23]|uniref:penicillin-insensitive murein endopeptidase n=1 Tax=Alexandriicola marinus TaxID=2081710 RepID=UPI000FD6DA64|nr:penicillin-insensitive murein endopeptidase [Alexandriicola marinus]MBM1219938.1 penicillin-insensitive murein endopeptidase [Ponticoccus sp. SC6-9]MBM1224624.1 penicillin-insensitive murein endopeptidase [Ponticoccus sp. SC6-15]MBM1228137.1 penicillin-insensitive murein endopeptidase [Ponticoccus sp. SC6-38]MBM1234225.1 penicillin-insensitive murein endopeptidase [Ponticoccus sp. SC6-45]MBM1238639.1 penicillin-insensitive murein endopeptidase [Ponticoccus sp. SC6-49]MBM1242420.1 penicilli
MIRPLARLVAPICAALLLAACQTDSGASVTQASVSSQNAGDNRVAKQLFGYIPTASSQSPAAIGGYARGCQAGAEQLAETGPTWQAMRLSRNRNWAQPQTIDYVQDLSRFAATLPGWAGLYVGDMSQPRGGPMLTGHASHQSGLDIDIWMLPPQRLDLTAQEREDLSSISTRRAAGAYTNDNWTEQHRELLRAAASDPRVARIFIFPGAKVDMCEWATGDRSWLRKIRPWWGHHYHFHVRLNCAPGDRQCEAQTPPPPGDGCDDARTWVNNILNPPPPDPNAPAPTPRGELTMADLPGACTAVLNSD